MTMNPKESTAQDAARLPDEWGPRPTDLKSGWKNNAKILAEIVTDLNDEIYIEDESSEMEKVDFILDWVRNKMAVYAAALTAAEPADPFRSCGYSRCKNRLRSADIE